MKKHLYPVIAALLVLFCSSPVFASIGQFTGMWVNTDSNTRGVTKLKITQSGGNVKLQAWGKCHPEDCDWGTVPAFIYAPSVSSNPMQKGRAVSAMFDKGFSQTLVIVKPMGNKLRAEVYTRFTDNSGRSNYNAIYTMKKAFIPIPPPAVLQEDCIPFNPDNAMVKNVNGSWKIVDGSHWMFDFGGKKAEAEKTLAIIKKYGFTRSCFIGRPGPSFQYMRK